jgi:hypothetical protein
MAKKKQERQEALRAALSLAVEAYKNGHLVVVQDEQGRLLHGEETLESIVATGVHLKCLCIKGVNFADYQKSDWPEVLEAARSLLMRGMWPLPPS